MGVSSRTKSPPLLAKAASGIASRATSLPVVLLLGSLMFVAVVAGVVAGWQRWGRTVVARPIYRLAAENIHVTAPPPWIRTDVRSEVVRDNGLTDLTIFDRDVTIRVYQAFELHPWVGKVRRVSKLPPARLDVELEYRQPIAWVEVPRGVIPGTEGGVIPIDRYSVVLPSRDFTEQNVADYLRIHVPGVAPCGLAGTPWGDPRVASAARIAELLADSWKTAGLFRIRWVSDADPARRNRLPQYELETRGHRRIIWGSPPDSEPSDEPTTQIKLARLQQLIATFNDLDRSPKPGWDLRASDLTMPVNATRAIDAGY